MEVQWFLTRDGETIAQYSTEEFRRAVQNGAIRPTDYIRRSDSSGYILASEFLPQPTHEQRSGLGKALAIVVLLGALGGGTYAALPYLPAEQARDFLSKLTEKGPSKREILKEYLTTDAAYSRFFRGLEQKNPQAFEALLTELSDKMSSSDIAEIRSTTNIFFRRQIVEQKSRFLQDPDRAEKLALSRDIARHLASSDADLCIAHALGKAPDDIGRSMTPELRNREADLMLKMLDAPPVQYELIPAREAQALNTKVAHHLFQSHGTEINLLDLEKVPDGKQATACRIFADYLDTVLKLPDNERIALTRVIELDPARLTEELPAETEAPFEFPSGIQ